ncbi:MAG: hypothetical protein IJF78_10765 [Clostridia bacterium]|nr:hypothetical protein [Clostridia bacterium]
MDKAAYEELVISETMRYIHLHERKYSRVTEDSQAVYSVWRLMNSGKFTRRENSFEEKVRTPGKFTETSEPVPAFTAHAHHGEPLISSPDDRLLYALTSDLHKRHFIVDRFSCRIIDSCEWQ